MAPNGDVFTIENGGGASDRVQRFTGSGAAVQPPFGTEGAGGAAWQQPISLVVSPASEVFVVDTFASKVSRYSASGSQLSLEWGTLGSGPGQFSSPEGLAFGSGRVYVADRGNNQVDAYGVTGAPVTQWGGSGSAPGLFNRIIEVAVGPTGDVYAVDRDNFRIQRFTADGTFVRAYGGVGGAGPGQFGTLADVAVDTAGDVWIADNQGISRYADNGTFKQDYERVGALLIRPNGLSFAPNGDLLISDVFPGSYRVIRAGTGTAAQGPAGGLAAPVLGKTVNVSRVSGRITIGVRAGGGSARASQKGVRFVALTQARSIPVGSFLNTRKGKVRLTSARNTTGKTQTGDFSAGLFQVLQSRKKSAKGLTELRLKGSSFKRCTARRSSKAQAAARRRLSRRAVRRLRSKATGRFRTRGRYSSATVRGTTWTTTDRCDGTLTKVTRGKVAVRDFRRKKTILLRRGKKYLARAGR